MTDTSDLVTKNRLKTDYKTKINKIVKTVAHYDHDKYITIQEFNKLTAEGFAARLEQTNLASKKGIPALLKKLDFDDKLKKFDKKVTSNKTKYLEAKNKNKKNNNNLINK